MYKFGDVILNFDSPFAPCETVSAHGKERH